jgi:hypothetical protein
MKKVAKGFPRVKRPERKSDRWHEFGNEILKDM